MACLAISWHTLTDPFISIKEDSKKIIMSKLGSHRLEYNGG